jgi:aspartate/methionine/tyrosine aminotransferase
MSSDEGASARAVLVVGLALAAGLVVATGSPLGAVATSLGGVLTWRGVSGYRTERRERTGFRTATGRVVDVRRERIDEDTQALVVISPNNPTGATIPEDVLEEICEIAWEHELLLITDDIYWELSFDDRPTTAGAIGDGPVVVLDGLSKSWLVPGWRAGWMAFRDPDDELAAIEETVMKQARLRLCAPAPMQAAIANAVEPNAGHFQEVRRRLERRAETVHERVQGTDALSMAEPEGAFYAFVRINDLDGSDKDWVLDLLEEEKVLTVPGSGFGDAGEGHFRMVYLPPVDQLEEAMDRIVRFAESR